MLIIGCEAVKEHFGRGNCCSTCHENAERDVYGGWMGEGYPPTRPGRSCSAKHPYGRVTCNICCEVRIVTNSYEWTRDDWAAMARIQRRMNREFWRRSDDAE